MHWILHQKAKSLELDKNQRKIIREKACSARDRAVHLLAIELSIEPNTIKHTVANSIAKRKAFASIQDEVAEEERKANEEVKADDNSDKDNNMDGKEEEKESGEVDSSIEDESSSPVVVCPCCPLPCHNQKVFSSTNSSSTSTEYSDSS